MLFVLVESKMPSYGELIDMLSFAEQSRQDVANVLLDTFKQQYPYIYIGRPKRLFETVSRIAAPTKQSTRGEPKLSGSPLLSCRKRQWIPRIRNTIQGW